MRHDARLWQVAVLSGVLIVGIFGLGFPLSWAVVVSTLAGSLLTEHGLSRLVRTRSARPLSALISGLSVLLLFRSSLVWTYPLVACTAVASKYAVHCRGQHVFNPTNCGILLGTLFVPGWISPGQWGHAGWLPLALGGFGILVLCRAGRLDSAAAFLGTALVLDWLHITYYGYPLAVVSHHFQNGALWLFALYMLPDPKTTPARRWARFVHAAAVALLAFVLAEWWYWTDTFLWSLFFLAPLVPVLNRLAERRAAGASVYVKEDVYMHHVRITGLLLCGLVLSPSLAHAFCGFYVSGADAKLYNSASQVVIVHDEDHTVLTMVNNYRGEPEEFALVIPVPVILEREMVRVIDPKAVEHLDAYSAPRLVEYHDPDPCLYAEGLPSRAGRLAGGTIRMQSARAAKATTLGVTVEAEYAVGEYDIVILSAEQSDGLETWLRQNDYTIPLGAASVLAPYIRSGMKFFVAKVNLTEHTRSGFTSLRPLQFAFTSPRFMLPIRLGMLNADGPQDLLIYFLTRRHRVEVTNYRNPRIPSDKEIPVYVKQEFKRFYTDLFQTATDTENQRAVFTEYAWNMGWCDPCATNPLSVQELESLGVWWLTPDPAAPGFAPGGGLPVFVTRLHARYDGQHFPEDLKFKLTGDDTNFQGRYVLRHAWKGEASCPAGEEYRRQLAQRHRAEARTLASLTGWDLNEIHDRMALKESDREETWSERIKVLFGQ